MNYFSKKNEKIILVGFPELRQNFETVNTFFLLSSKFWLKFMFPNINKYNLDTILRFLSVKLIPRLYLFKIVEFDDKSNQYKISSKKALFKNVFFTINFFCQTEKYINKNKFKNIKFIKKILNYLKIFAN